MRDGYNLVCDCFEYVEYVNFDDGERKAAYFVMNEHNKICDENTRVIHKQKRDERELADF